MWKRVLKRMAWDAGKGLLGILALIATLAGAFCMLGALAWFFPGMAPPLYPTIIGFVLWAILLGFGLVIWGDTTHGKIRREERHRKLLEDNDE